MPRSESASGEATPSQRAASPLTSHRSPFTARDKGGDPLSRANFLWRRLSDFARDQSGQDLIEYALIAGLIGLAAVVAMSGLAAKVRTSFNTVGNSLTNAL